jgi:hypothetical protein
MFKILSDEAICKAGCKGWDGCVAEPNTECERFEELKAVAQAQAREDAKRLLEGRIKVIVPGKLLDITVTVTPEEYEMLRQMAQLAD